MRTTTSDPTSQLYYVLHGRGFSVVNGSIVRWSKGDFLTLPAGSIATHHAEDDTAFYWVTDEPLMRYLGVEATTPLPSHQVLPRGRGRRTPADRRGSGRQ